MKLKELFKVLRRWPVYLWFFRRGVIRGRWDRLYEDFKYDFLRYKKTTFKQKRWAYKRGFLSERINRYGMDESNWINYISDIEFYKKSSYKNLRFVYWFDDKLTTWYILQPFKEHLPEHYYSIENKKIRELNQTQAGADNSVEGIFELLSEKKELAFKQTRGGHGRGFFKIAFTDGVYSIDNKTLSKQEVEKTIRELDGYIITEYVYAHSQLAKLYAATPEDAKKVTPCVIRIVTVYDEKEGAQVAGTLIRIGAVKAGLKTDYDGAVLCGIDYKDGTLFRPLIDVESFSTEPCPVHPDSGVKIEGQVPNWEYILREVLRISNTLNNTPYLTYDIVPTETGFKILEINSHGITRILQPFYPFYANEYTRKLFKP